MRMRFRDVNEVKHEVVLERNCKYPSKIGLTEADMLPDKIGFSAEDEVMDLPREITMSLLQKEVANLPREITL